MKNQFIGLILSGFMVTMISACEPSKSTVINLEPQNISKFYSTTGTETEVEFTAVFKTTDYSLEAIQTMNDDDRKRFKTDYIKPTIKYLFGPLTNAELGGMRTEMNVVVAWDQAFQEKKQVVIPYKYNGIWIVSNKLMKNTKTVTLPLPYNAAQLYTKNWLSCTDSDPEHQTRSFFWYFWDPKRTDCDHVLDQDYQMIDLKFVSNTENTIETYPEYKKLIQSRGIKNNFQMTYAFGYVSDVADANPDIDNDYGMQEYRKFIKFMDRENAELKFVKSAIYQKEYLNPRYPNKQIGYRYSGVLNKVQIEIKVVTSANIDQMELFAQSYAHDHDGYFSWFGHSRVGSGFDAEQFDSMLKYNPEYYSLSSQYQLVYWAGCNSYSYYTQPFFKQKSKLDAINDPSGSKNLDIIANGLPSLFSFNADNAIIMHKALMNWENPTSYQKIVSTLEKRAARSYTLVLVNILGEEDNLK